MDRGDFLFGRFKASLGYGPTSCQESLFRDVASFLTEDNGDILVVNGYAGTGKTTAMAAVVSVMKGLKVPVVLLAPTGRSAKVLSSYTHAPAYTIHKHIYRQKSLGSSAFGEFSLSPNKARDTLFIVDEVSLIGIDSAEQKSAVFGSGNLLEDLVTFVRNGLGCRLIMVGDAAQLPPVGLDESPALSPDYMEGFSGVLYSTLTTVVRQEKESGILFNATALRRMIAAGEGEYDPSEVKFRVDGFDDMERIGGGELLETLSDAYGKWGEDEVIVLCRSNRRANRYNAGIRSMVQYKEESLVRGDKLMIVKNCYQFVSDVEGMDYIANGDIAKLLKIRGFEERYGLHFATASLSFPDYGDQEITAKVCLDTLSSESAALTYEQQNALYQGVLEDYSHLATKKKRYDAVKEDPYYNALQLKYAEAVTCHKSQGGQWQCVFIDNPLWQEEITVDDLKWLYTALTRAVSKVYLVNFPDRLF